MHRRVGTTLLGAALLLVAAPQRLEAQAHPLIGPGPSLQARLRRADAVALARVSEVEPGRLRLERLRTLAGEVPERFALKRSPLAPPPHGAGDLGLFFLRGARSPYVAVEAARDMLRVESEEDGLALARAVEALRGAGDDPVALLDLHVVWLEGPNPTLSKLALASFLDPQAPFAPLPDGFAVARAESATDPARAPEARRAAAALAALRSDGLARLLAWAPGGGHEGDGEILALTLGQAAALGAPGTEAALARTLEARDPAARLAALAAARRLAAGLSPTLRAAVERLAAQDESDQVRALARRLLEGRDARLEAGPRGRTQPSDVVRRNAWRRLTEGAGSPRASDGASPFGRRSGAGTLRLGHARRVPRHWLATRFQEASTPTRLT